MATLVTPAVWDQTLSRAGVRAKLVGTAGARVSTVTEIDVEAPFVASAAVTW